MKVDPAGARYVRDKAAWYSRLSDVPPDALVLGVLAYCPEEFQESRPEDRTTWLTTNQGTFEIDRRLERLYVGGQHVRLTPTQYTVLTLLVDRRGEPITYGELALQALGADDESARRALRVHVYRLRTALGAFDFLVETVKNIGYRFDWRVRVKSEVSHG